MTVTRDAVTGADSVVDATGRAQHAYLKSLIAGERNPGTTNDHQITRQEWNLSVITGTLGDNTVSAVPCHVRAMRVGGTANTVGATQIKDSTVVKETLAAASTPGTSRDFYSTRFETSVIINLGNVADTILVWWRPIG